MSKPGITYLFTHIHLSAVFFLFLAPFNTLESLQSSMNFEEGLGTTSISLFYAGRCVCCLFLGALTVQTLGPKLSLKVGFIPYITFLLANIWPSMITMLPASLILGIFSSFCFIAQGTYTTVLAKRYSECTHEDFSHVLALFSGIFNVFWGISKPVGNLVASFVLNAKVDGSIGNANCTTNMYLPTNNTFVNKSYITSENLSAHYILSPWNLTTTDGFEVLNNVTTENSSYLNYNCTDYAHKLEYCGPNHCPYMKAHTDLLIKPSQQQIYMLMGIFLCFNAAGMILMFLVKRVPATKYSNVCDKVKASVTIMKEVDLLLLIPPSALLGIVPGTFYATFSQSFVSCTFGIGMVGYSMVCEGLGFSLASFVCGPISKYIPRIFHVALALFMFTVMPIWWMNWQPSPSEFWVIVIISLVYGAMNGIFRTHITAMVSALFPSKPEIAFSQYSLWNGIGFTFTFAYTPYLCFTEKMYIVLTAVSLTAIAYFILEYRIRTKKTYVEVKRNNHLDSEIEVE